MNSNLYGSLLLSMGILVLSAVIVPFFSEKRKLAGWLNFAFTAVAGFILLNISYSVIFERSLNTELWTIAGFLPVYLLLDSFAGFFLAIIAVMSIMSAFYSIDYMEHYHDYSLKSYYVNYPIFIAGMVAIITVDDLTTGFTVAWQMMTIASYFLVKFEYKKPENVKSANKYLVLMEIAWLLILVGAFVAGSGLGDSIHAVTRSLGASTGVIPFIVYALIFLGFGFKAAIFPFGQMWLPDAHSIAPSPISALLSGVMIKTGVYGIIRTFFWMIPHNETFHFSGSLWGAIIAVFGVVTLFIGTVQSMKQSNSKRLLAFSSIGQVGYIIFGIGAAVFMFNSNSHYLKLLALIAIIGAVYHVLNHAVFKGLLFLTSGSVLFATDSKDLNKLGGLIKYMPVTAIIAGIASLSISGVPPFSGFASKWTLISTSLLAGNEVFFLVIFGIIALFTSAITLSCYVKFFGMTFTSAGTEWTVDKQVKEVGAGMLLPKFILAALCIVQGVIPFFYFNTIIAVFQNSGGSMLSAAFRNMEIDKYVFNTAMGVTVEVPGLSSAASMAVPVVVLVIFAIALCVALLLTRSGGNTERQAETWLCGYQTLNNRNRYMDSSMFAALKAMFGWTGGNVKK